MKVFNSISRKNEEFVPADKKTVRMYTCGPTVYNYAHIGNFRAYIFEDILRRYLKFQGYDVTQVMNLTDVDDKTIKGAIARKVSLGEYTKTYVDAFFADLKALNIEPAEHYPAATDHVPEMIALIERLFERGAAYRSDDGSIYFNITSYPEYGKLAHLDIEGLKAGARVEHDEYDKDNVADFALWKSWDEQDGDVWWDSPWGKGRPGWHIECSAMGMKYLGESFDIHTGGVDNMFPHHENEIAQSEGATGEQFVNYWMHNGFVRINDEKMSKSLNNFFTLREILEKYRAEEVRYFILTSQYRSPLNYDEEHLINARGALTRFYTAMRGLPEAQPAGGESHVEAFMAAMDDDINTPVALAAMFDLAREVNRVRKENLQQAAALGAQLKKLGGILGILQQHPDDYLKGDDGSGLSDAEIDSLIVQRGDAKAAKDWGEADRIRDKLQSQGVVVEDSAQGTTWRRGS